MLKKLTDLIHSARYESEILCNKHDDCHECPMNDYGYKCKDGYVARYLIAHGVTIQDREEIDFDYEAEVE